MRRRRKRRRRRRSECSGVKPPHQSPGRHPWRRRPVAAR
jgi:hypothetical protein